MVHCTQPKTRSLSTLLLLTLSLLNCICVQAQSVESSDIKLHIPVISSNFPDEIKALKGDLQKLGLNNISVETVDYGHSYQNGLRSGHEGIYFAAPHFAAWAIEHHGFLPLVHLSEPLAYVIAVERSKPNLFEISDLAGKQICARKPLNLDYLLINKVLLNSLVPAKIKIVNRVSDQMKLQDTACEAFSVSRHIFDRFEKQDSERFIKLYQTKNYVNYGLVSHPNIEQSDLKKLTKYFLRDQTQLMLKPILREFADSSRILRSSNKHYLNQYWEDLEPYWQAP